MYEVPCSKRRGGGGSGEEGEEDDDEMMVMMVCVSFVVGRERVKHSLINKACVCRYLGRHIKLHRRDNRVLQRLCRRLEIGLTHDRVGIHGWGAEQQQRPMKRGQIGM